MKIEIRKPTPEEADAAKAWKIWTCQPSSFEWGYSQTETCLMLEGRAKVEAMGREFVFEAGDWVVFPKGLACRWHVIEAVKKHYVFDDN